jgi:hypothetical protein
MATVPPPDPQPGGTPGISPAPPAETPVPGGPDPEFGVPAPDYDAPDPGGEPGIGFEMPDPE